jgi:serine/threonine protein kinase
MAPPNPDKLFVPQYVQIDTEYRIERFHAQGGLGCVYLATDAELQRRVAIKFPRSKYQTAEQSARFEREAEITGRLDHPGIIPVHAMTSEGTDLPFYVMRFVDGRTMQMAIDELHSAADAIAAIKDERFFQSVDFRLLLLKFVSVCNIVAYAHEQKVIHRDIKPANIIIGPFGEVLLLDWGLAKVLDEPVEDRQAVRQSLWPDGPNGGTISPEVNCELTSGLAAIAPGNRDTVSGQILGTPAFASPEQLFGKAEETDVRSDVYSLGATLFTLLTGTIVMRSGGLPPYLNRLQRNERISTHEVNRLIPRPLEAICCHAMAANPEHRYPSALAMALDIERYLAGESISILRDPITARCGRMIRKRPRTTAAIIAAAFVILIAGSTGSLILNSKNQQLQENNNQLATVVRTSQSAGVQALQALRTLFDEVITQRFSSQTSLTEEERTFLNNILQQYKALAALQGNSTESRAIRAEGFEQSGHILVRLSDEYESRRNFEAAAEICSQLLKETGRTEFLNQLASASLALCESLQRDGELHAAEQTASDCIAVIESSGHQSGDQQSSDTLLSLARLYSIRGKLQAATTRRETATESLLKANEVLEQLLVREPGAQRVLRELAGTCCSLSDLCQRAIDFSGHDNYSGRAVDCYRRLLQEDPRLPELQKGFVHACYRRSFAHEFFDRIEPGLQDLSEAIEISGHLTSQFPLSDEYREIDALMRIRRAEMYCIRSQFYHAVDDYRSAVYSMEKTVKDSSNAARLFETILSARRKLAGIHSGCEFYAEAETTLRNALRKADSFRSEYPDAASASWAVQELYFDLAEILHRQERTPESLELLQQWLQSPGPRSGDAVQIVQSIGQIRGRTQRARLLWQSSRHQEARDHIAKASLIAANLPIEQISQVSMLERAADCHSSLASVYQMFDCPEDSTIHYQKQMLLLKRIGERAPERLTAPDGIIATLTETGQSLTDAGLFSAARQQLLAAESAMMTAMTSLPDTSDDIATRKSRGNLRLAQGRLLLCQGQYPDAWKLCEEAVLLNPSPEHQASLLRCLVHPGTNARSPGKPEMAISLQETDRLAESSLSPGPGMIDLLIACGEAARNSGTPDTQQAFEAAVIRFLNRLHAQGSVISRELMIRLQSHAEVSQLLKNGQANAILEQLNPGKNGRRFRSL